MKRCSRLQSIIGGDLIWLAEVVPESRSSLAANRNIQQLRRWLHKHTLSLWLNAQVGVSNTVREGHLLVLGKKAWVILINSHYSAVTQHASEHCRHNCQKTGSIACHCHFFFSVLILVLGWSPLCAHTQCSHTVVVWACPLPLLLISHADL